MVPRAAAPGGRQALWSRPAGWLRAKGAWIEAAVGVLFISMTLYILWAVRDLPDPSQDVLAAGDVVVLDRNGKLIEDWSPAGHYHVNLALQDMGPYAPKAVMAAEDRNFYNHGAIDPVSTARALWIDVTQAGLNEGGSTITQQLVKIQLLTRQKSLTRKVQELILAETLEQRYSKDQILSMYLNRVYFGHGAYGVEHVQGYQTFANQGQRADLSVIREVDRTGGHAIYTHNTPNPTAVLTPAKAFLMSDVLKNYQNQWHFGWNRQMASKTGTSDNGTGGIPDSWIMAYNPDIVVCVWVGNTAPNGGGGLIRAYGENVGLTTMKRFVNALPSNMRDWYSQPPGIVRGCGSDTQDPFLEGVCQVSPKPSSSTSPTRTPSAGPTSSPNPTPVLSPSPSTATSPAPSPAPSPTPAAPASPKPTPT
ncbi:MAG: transglycosylase domain-containing protein [Candidatus Dormibacterales bacterium]